jgi:hypothetical protein
LPPPPLTRAAPLLPCRSSKAAQEDLDVVAEAQEELRLLELRARDYKELAMRQGIRLDVGGAWAVGPVLCWAVLGCAGLCWAVL